MCFFVSHRKRFVITRVIVINFFYVTFHMAENDLDKEQILFYEKVASYVSRHPEFVEELQKRMEEEENNISREKTSGKSKEKYSSSNKSYAAGENNEKNAQNKDQKIKGIFKLDEEKINTISKELSGMLFDKDGSNKSVLETTVQDAFSSMVKNYLSKYAG
jgi:hypothetical protein